MYAYGDSPGSATKAPAKPGPLSLQGYIMDVKEETSRPSSKASQVSAPRQDWYPLWVSLPVLVTLFAWRRYRRP
jgi:hypothetical protein